MVEIKHFSFRYGEDASAASSLRDVCLTIASGEFVVLCGKSSCGKTTLTRAVNGLIPHFYEGALTGEVLVNGENVTSQPLAKTAQLVGSVFQNPRSQFFNVDTTSELAFGCENLGLPVPEIWDRVAEASAALDVDRLMDRSIFELSGGQKQRIACASVCAVRPDVFVLDEPSSNLDVAGVEQLRKVLSRLKADGKTILISEHRLHYLADLADRFVYIEDGHIAGEYTQREMKAMPPTSLAELGLRRLSLEGLEPSLPGRAFSDAFLSIRNLTCRYGGCTVLQIPALDLRKGDIIAVVGHNGAGKSTLAGCLCGMTKHKGTVNLGGKPMKAHARVVESYMVMQDVNHQLFTESVKDEVTLGARQIQPEVVEQTLEQMGLGALVNAHPLALSGGQKQRVAIAGAMCAGKRLLVYDEPTSGQDYRNMMATCGLIGRAAQNAFLSLVITHDLEFILACCNSVLELADGKVAGYYPLDGDGVWRVKKHFLLAQTGDTAGANEVNAEEMMS
ncbi:ABC transporter ATP-binding protein [Oscillospiraceae bacterium OttesenSCG-928-F05]|nr:ABC transporter ATP-binding protein [Oscillospiraceae bacterium OttesenSCG-928-F05]